MKLIDPYEDGDKLMCATHNRESVEMGLKLKELYNVKPKNTIEYSQLMGMADDLSDKLVNNGEKVYKYVPFGNYRDMVPYFSRRLYENYSIIRYMF